MALVMDAVLGLTCWLAMLLLLQRLGVRKALVVHSQGLDELTPMGPADVVEVTQQGVGFGGNPGLWGLP